MKQIEHEGLIEKFLQAHFSDATQCQPYDENLQNEFLKLGPLHYFIPTSMGGRRENAESYLRIVEKTSYASLPLGLTLGITGSLFLLPTIKHANPILRDKVIPDFLNGPALGGIMITEPTGGTDIFGLQSTISVNNGKMTLNGKKCWGGLTGKAEHWLVAARKKQGDRLTRSLNLVYVSLASKGVAVDHYFDALGLNPITYGETHYTDVVVADEHNLTPKGISALRVMYDTLFRSRMSIPAIASGLCKRLSDECTARASQRIVFGKSIDSYDLVQARLSTIRGLAQINHCFCKFSADWVEQHDDISGDYLLVNTVKVISSKSMADAADSAMHLFAAAAFKRNHLVGRAYIDSRPFQIFEGSNDVLDDNTFEVIAGRYGAVNPEAINQELEKFGLRLPDNLLAGTLSILNIKKECTQRQQVHYGKIIEWIVTIAILEHMRAKESTLVEDAMRVAKLNIAARIAELPYLH